MIALLWLLAGTAAAQEAGRWSISADEWASPRSGLRVATMQPVRDAVQGLLQAEGARLVIRYPGGEMGSLWADELRDWLIALGVESERVITQPGSETEDAVDLIVEQP